MATRAHLREQITSDKIGALTPVAFATVSVYETGTTTPVAATMYQTASGVGVFTNPLTADANGVVEFWMTNAQVVDLAITAAGYNSATVTAQVIGTDTATGILNLNTTTTPTVPGDVRINGENFTYEGAASLHTAGTLDQAQTYTGLKTFSGGVSADGTHTLTLPAATDTLVGKATTDTLTNKTLTTPVIIGSGGTLTLPAGPDTLVGKATTDTLTNKTLTGNTLASFTPDGTHTVTAPVATDTLVGKATTDTLTNKTFDASSNVGAVRLADTTLGASATNITFSSIPGTYKHLRIVMQTRGDGALVSENVCLQFNGDTANNYDSQILTGNNVTASASVGNAAAQIFIGAQPGANAAASVAAAVTIDIPNYLGTTFFKSIKCTGGFAEATAANQHVAATSGNWRSTAAITSIKLFPQTSTNFVAGTRATLYGVN